MLRTALRFALHLAIAFGLISASNAEIRDPNQHFFHTTLGDYRAEFAQAKQERKKGVVFVYEMEECPFCDRLHNQVLNRSEVQDFYQMHFLVFRIDTQGSAPVVDVDGKTSTEKAMSVRTQVRGTPTIVFWSPEGRELVRYVGPPKDAGEFLLLGRYVLEGAYEKGSFAQYRQEHRKP